MECHSISMKSCQTQSSVAGRKWCLIRGPPWPHNGLFCFFSFLSGVYFRILQLVLLPCSSKLVIKTVKWRSYFWFLAEGHWDVTPLPALSSKSITTTQQCSGGGGSATAPPGGWSASLSHSICFQCLHASCIFLTCFYTFKNKKYECFKSRKNVKLEHLSPV